LRYCYRGRSNRLEKKISSARSNKLLEEEFDYDKCFIQTPHFEKYQGQDGGLSQVIWGGSDLSTSLWAFIVAPEEFNKESLIKYFESQFANSQGNTDRKIEAGWALSLLGKSKLRDLQGMANSVFSFQDKVNLALALSYLGDNEVARNMYLNILADYGYALPPYIRVDSNQDRGNKSENFVLETANVLLLGEMVEKKYNEGLYKYVNDHRGDLENYLIDLAEISYIKSAIAALPDSDTIFSLTKSTGVENLTLDKGRSKVFELSPADVDTFNFSLEAGKAELLTKYRIGINTLNTKTQDDRISIKRTYSKINKDNSPIKPGDIIRIDLDLTMNLESAPKGSYEVKDILPSGLSYVSNPYSFGLTSGYYFYSDVEKNVLKFYTCNSTYCFKNNKQTITYYARASAVGKYKAEPAVFQSLDNLTVFNKTGIDEVVIE